MTPVTVAITRDRQTRIYSLYDTVDTLDQFVCIHISKTSEGFLSLPDGRAGYEAHEGRDFTNKQTKNTHEPGIR